MNAQELINSLCCSYGWCYGILWGFHHTNSILLTFKEAYYEPPMGGLLDSLLLQAHVLGGGVIGEAALMKNNRWLYSDQSPDCFEVFQDDSDFFYQFSMGIKTITVISVEPWGVLQFGSTHKIPEIQGFVDQVKQLFREMDTNEPYFLHQNSLLPPSSDYQSRNFIFPIENLIQIHSDNVIDTDCSLLASSWPRALDEAMPSSKRMDCENSSLDEFFHGSNFGISTQGLEDDLSHCLSPHASGLIHNLPTNSLQSSMSDALISSLEECISEKHNGSTSKSLFSELGLDQLLDGTASTSHGPLGHSGFKDHYGSHTKRRKTDNFSWSNKFEGLPSFGRGMKSLNRVNVNSEDLRRESHPCNGERCRAEEEAKGKKKKKGKAGSRTRPKDRQMIQDRLAELRELIPNGYKMSIDRLLEGTIRHLNFMQSLTKHAQSLKQIDETKNVNVERGGVTWACEVGDRDTVCPLLVEDSSNPGQMLIEMVCEEEGLFLEIVDVIRGFGLIIRKGVMEVDGRRKIRGEFVVEAEVNRRVSRHEIFSSLIQLLQLNTDAFNNFQASSSLPINLPHALQCVNQ